LNVFKLVADFNVPTHYPIMAFRSYGVQSMLIRTALGGR
jgi:hypothetical protein